MRKGICNKMITKKDIATIRKEFKEDSFKLRIKDLFVVYIQKGKAEIFHHEHTAFTMLDADQQELYRQNFKKVLAGNLDEKLFEIKFNTAIQEDHAQSALLKATSGSVEDFKEVALDLVARTVNEENTYEDDVIFSFIRAEYRLYEKKKKGDDQEEDRSMIENFIFGTMNKTSTPKKALMFDYTNKEFKPNLVLDAMINLTTPVQGFMFPTFLKTFNVDVNHVLYSTSKKNVWDRYFIENGLHGKMDDVDTAENEAAYFNEVLHTVLDGKASPKVISDVFYRINRVIESEQEEEDYDGSPIVLDYKDVSNILIASGVEIEDPAEIKAVFKEVVDNEKYEFNAEHIMAQKDIQIDASLAKVKMSTVDLQKIKQVRQPNGKLTLVIEIDDEVQVNGLTLQTEEAEEI